MKSLTLIRGALLGGAVLLTDAAAAIAAGTSTFATIPARTPGRAPTLRLTVRWKRSGG